MMTDISIGFLSLLALSSCGADNSGVESLPGVDSSVDNGVVIETTRKVYYVVDYSINSKDYSEIKQNIGKEVTTLGGYIEKIPEDRNKMVDDSSTEVGFYHKEKS